MRSSDISQHLFNWSQKGGPRAGFCETAQCCFFKKRETPELVNNIEKLNNFTKRFSASLDKLLWACWTCILSTNTQSELRSGCLGDSLGSPLPRRPHYSLLPGADPLRSLCFLPKPCGPSRGLWNPPAHSWLVAPGVLSVHGLRTHGEVTAPGYLTASLKVGTVGSSSRTEGRPV